MTSNQIRVSQCQVVHTFFSIFLKGMNSTKGWQLLFLMHFRYNFNVWSKAGVSESTVLLIEISQSAMSVKR